MVGESNFKNECKRRLIVELLKVKDKMVRGVKMIVSNNFWERPVQLICPLEIESTLTPEELNRRIPSTRRGKKLLTFQKDRRGWQSSEEFQG